MMADDDKPFACPEDGCKMRFTNEDHLTVHRMKHDMSLPLTPGLKPGQLLTFADQTPTPTRFLRNCEEIGLFNELKSNPFEEAFKKASDYIGPDGKIVEQPGQTSVMADTTMESGNLNTPIPLLGPRNPTPLTALPSLTTFAARPSQLVAGPPSSAFGPLPGPNKEVGSTVTLSSPVTLPSPVIEVTIDAPVMSPPEAMVMSPQESKSLRSIVSEPTSVVASSVTAVTSPLSLPKSEVKSEPSPGVVGTVAMSPTAGTVAVAQVVPGVLPQYMLQVMVQMPGGDMVPVQIPAAPAALSQCNVPTGLVSMTASGAGSSVVAVGSGATAATAPLSTKQILKAALQQQSMKVAIDDLDRTKVSDRIKSIHQVSPPVRTLINRVGRLQTTHVRSPLTLPVTTATSPMMVTSPSGSLPSVMSPRLQVHDVDTSTPRGMDTMFRKRSRSSSPEEDSDERRRKFLERNRAAAARCRAKKKMWIGGLERKADDMQDVNARLQSEVTHLRNEVAELKSLLLAHKDCPITLEQRNAGLLSFTGVTPKAEPPEHAVVNVVCSRDEEFESEEEPGSLVTLTNRTNGPVGSPSSAQSIILNILPLVHDGS